MKDPQQELFTRLKLDLEAQGYSVYDGFLPPDKTPYPFIYLADNQTDDETTKTAILGRVRQTIHVWHNNPDQRGTVSNMLLAIKQTCRKIDCTANFAWHVSSMNQRILADRTTKTPLIHGIVTVELLFS